MTNGADPDSFQTAIDFESAKWPDHESFPLNKKIGTKTVEQVVSKDIADGIKYLIITGFTSLSNLVDFFGSREFEKLNKTRILIGFEPNIRGRRKYDIVKLDKVIKEYWLRKGLSIMSGGAVIRLIQKIDSGSVEFRYKDKLHAKIYVGDEFAILGSSNFSKNGLTTQEEANIRVSKLKEVECDQFYSIEKIAENYYEEAVDYNIKVKELLGNLIQQTSWEEALARAIVELLEGEWLAEYREILDKLKSVSLWPTQWKGLAQAISILQRNYNVLIADPTGAGKTKLSTSVVLALKHWLYQIGKNYSTNSLVICPPLVVSKWEEEFRSLKSLHAAQLSMGLLSNAGGNNSRKVKACLDIAKILTIDEAHNYLSITSKRTKLIKSNRAEYKIMVTATPISKKVEDLLRLIELLDLDNLSDEDFQNYSELVKKPYLRTKQEHIQKLRKFISQFTVRRTKRFLNTEIVKKPENYKNRLDRTCKFPTQIEKTYDTCESEEDITLVKEISELASKLKGITYLTSFNKPTFEISKEESLTGYIEKRVNAARALSVYMIRSALRSSQVALIEHIEGTESAMEYFGFNGKTNSTGNKLENIQKLIDSNKLPRKNKVFKDEYFPPWLIQKDDYLQACNDDLKIYQSITKLAKKLSGKRERGKVRKLMEISSSHEYVLAFDSTVITLYYLKSLFSQTFPEKNVLVATGSEKDRDSHKVINSFNLMSEINESAIALCSDKMSESIDLQKASAVFLLDMPSVLRIVEQRIGRADRMDSLHGQIEIYWPNDSEAYSLKADKRLLETNSYVDQIFGSNFNIPQELKDKHFENVEDINSMIMEFKDFVNKDESWQGISDSFQPIVELIEGDNPIIDNKTYEAFKGIKSSVRTRVSFMESDKNWCFIALRGENNRSPKWYFIDDDETIHTEFPEICTLLRKSIGKKSKGLDWNDEILRKYIADFKEKERSLLPFKKRRALEVAEYILNSKLKGNNFNSEEKTTIRSHLKLLKSGPDFAVDYELLADEWVSILQPILNEKRKNLKRRRTVLNLSSLKKESKVDLPFEILNEILEKAPLTDDVDNKIASCIIGIAGKL